jgi:hypothetical protein
MQVDSQEYSKVEAGSSRSFGIVFAVVFAVIGLYPALSTGQVRIWALVVGALFLVVAVAIPRVLQPLNMLWFKFGILLGRIVNPIVMAIIYASTILPIGLIFRLIGKDPLNRKFLPSESSYWVVRAPPGPAPESLKEQF